MEAVHDPYCPKCGPAVAWPCALHTRRVGDPAGNARVRTKRGTVYVIDDVRSFVETLFPDGTKNTGVPDFDDPGSVERARGLGYGTSVCRLCAGAGFGGHGDACPACGGKGVHEWLADADVVWQMNRDHDLLHTLVSEAAGLDLSPSLRHAIDGPPPKGVIPMEESVVFFVQRMLVRLQQAGMGTLEAAGEIFGAEVLPPAA